MPKPYTYRTDGVFGGFWSCAFVTRSGVWSGSDKKILQKYLDQILTRSEHIPVIFVTKSNTEELFEQMIAEYPEYITCQCDTPTQHPGEHYRVRLWVAHIHEPNHVKEPEVDLTHQPPAVVSLADLLA